MEIDLQTKELLRKLKFEPTQGQPKLFQYKGEKSAETCPADTEAYIDFRSVNGRRFAMKNKQPLDDEDSIPILKLFKEEKDKLQSSSTNQGFHTSSIGTPDNTKSSGVDINKEASADDTKGKEIVLQKVNTTNHPPSGVTSPASPTLTKSVFFDEIVPLRLGGKEDKE